ASPTCRRLAPAAIRPPRLHAGPRLPGCCHLVHHRRARSRSDLEACHAAAPEPRGAPPAATAAPARLLPGAGAPGGAVPEGRNPRPAAAAAPLADRAHEPRRQWIAVMAPAALAARWDAPPCASGNWSRGLSLVADVRPG